MRDRVAVVAAAVVGVIFVGFGLWAVLDPRGFYDGVATWPPYNVHFVHDIGTFQVGIGSALLLALFRSDALFVALGAAALGQSVHAVMHITDARLGGKPADPAVMSTLAIFLVVAAWSRSVQRPTRGRLESPAEET